MSVARSTILSAPSTLAVAVALILAGCAAVEPQTALAQDAASPAMRDEPAMSGLQLAADVSPAARATQPESIPDYSDPRAMLENADMSAFMSENRQMYAEGERGEGWGFAAIDMLAAGETETMLALIEAMPPARDNAQALSRDWLKPWALAANSKTDKAVAAMKTLRNDMPEVLYRGELALLLEAVGRYDAAVKAYDLGEDELWLPDEDEDPTQESLMQTLAFGKYRILAFRKADLLRKQGRDDEARELYDYLLAADDEDYHARENIKELDKGEAPDEPTLTLKQALALALSDEANLIEERQTLASVILAKSAEAPFNHFVSALRQSALVLDPANSGIRSIESSHLYQYGFFEAAARIALAGEATSEERAGLMLSAAQSYVELGRFERASALVEEVLKRDGQDGVTLLNAAELMIRADQGERAAELAARARDADLREGLISFAYITESEARMQAGDVDAAIKAARKAADIDAEDEAVREFLASQLLSSPKSREEGLGIYRELYLKSPESPAMMNNFGYSLINNSTSPEQLDEGYRLLKKANRVTPFEPNLLDSLGWAYYQYGDFERALELIEKAVEYYEPFSHWELLDHYGDILYRLGRVDEAENAWRRSVDARPPRHKRAAINAKIENGITSPAPKKRTPPVVKSAEPVETNDI